MARALSATKAVASGIAAWLGRYLMWIASTMLLTLGGASALMLLKDWDLEALFTSMMAWPMLALGALLAIPVAMLPLGRPFLYTSVAWALIYNLILLIA